jgi:hypothetical protein
MTRHFASPLPINVTASPDGVPTHVVWRGRREAVRVCNHWKLECHWWKGGQGEVSRGYYKLLASSGAVLVVYQDRSDGAWYLEKILD